MKRMAGTSLFALAVAALLSSLSFVAWRQGTALSVLEDLDAVQRERSLSEAEKTELNRRVEVLESRSRVETEAWRRLNLRRPHDYEIVTYAGESS
ncbi:hypothetical protein ACFL3S_08640 [Gemmatimonadota bacterium]